MDYRKLVDGLDGLTNLPFVIYNVAIMLPSPLLLLSYGSPERQEDVVPFLHNLFAGRNVTDERIAAASQKYERYAAKTGHYSPLNTECRKLIEGIQQIAPNLPIYWGNLFWHPLLADTVAEMAWDGVKHAVCFATSAFDSPSGNQRYADALVNPLVKIEKLPLPFEHPLFIEAQVERLLATCLCGTPAPRILFTAHSISLADAAQTDYVEQLQSTCRAVINKSGLSVPWELVYQSRSGQPENWLGPDIKGRIRELAAEGHCQSVIVSPIGFFCENMETEYDLDIEVGKCCKELGLSYYRAKAVGAMPKICRMIVELHHTSPIVSG